MLGFFCKLWVTFNQWCAGKLALQGGKKSSNVLSFNGINTPTTADFKLPR